MTTTSSIALDVYKDFGPTALVQDQQQIPQQDRDSYNIILQTH